jgi:surfeit locus 1 family protein
MVRNDNGTVLFRRQGPRSLIVERVGIVLAVLLLLGFGAWQLQRLEYKTQFIEQMDRSLAAPPVNFAGIPAAAPDWEWRRVRAEGLYLHDKEILLSGRARLGRLGQELVTPLQLADGRIVLVNRGWVPMTRDGETEIARPQGPIEVVGRLRQPPRRGWFTPDNLPAKDEWYRLLPNEVAQAQGLSDVLSVYVASEPGDAKGYPIAQDTVPSIHNGHRGYAIMWFSLAGLAAAMYVAALVRRRRVR